MTESEFMQFFNKYLNEEILPTMIGKGLGQYSTHEDRFHNFKKLSGLKGETKEKCLTDLVAKQIVCLFDQMAQNKGNLVPTPLGFKILDEVIKDIIIYMFLLRGMIWELENVPKPVNDPCFAQDLEWPSTLSGGYDFGPVRYGSDSSKQG
jgi:hypothetical protein